MKPDDAPLPNEERRLNCPQHGDYVGVWTVRAPRKQGDLAPAYGWTVCQLCQKGFDQLNLEEQKRWQEKLPAEPKKPPVNVDPAEQGRLMGLDTKNTDPHHDRLPHFDHSCGVYKR